MVLYCAGVTSEVFFSHTVKTIVKEKIQSIGEFFVHIIYYNMSIEERNLLRRSICDEKQSKQIFGRKKKWLSL